MERDSEALEVFSQAQAADESVRVYDPVDVGEIASILVKTAYDFHSSTMLGDASAATATVARALKCGTPDTRAKIIAGLFRSKHWSHQQSLAELGLEPTWSAADRVLSALLQFDLPKPQPKPKPANAD